MTSIQTLTGECPECETGVTTPPIEVGETMGCPECMLTLRVEGISEGVLDLRMVEVQLRDWGE
ncbi:alpha-aminoadipate carrier protein LysW [Actinopolyspora alba]|uniref:Alpha-aminoadipate carrier protein LysW n=1 Tax=Actinopolyspora alba TaxID=673379 RepID=A0A1I1VPD0_9ACTN|nr:lysine biosynthesis protein LysW [Actinopolyspora alba]SFD84877.1 alpha-aminoadipate carrier protein LysW [Actinopolyspora alba]